MRQEIVKLGSYVSCIDTTGIIMVKIFKSNVPCYNKCVDLGDTIIVRIIGKNIKTKFLQDIKIKFRFRRGSLHKAIVVHTKNLYKRANRRYIWFPKNAIILVNKARVPFSKRLRLGIPREIAKKYPKIGAISPRIY